jgi:hypothetical protein
MNAARNKRWARFFGYFALLMLAILCSDVLAPTKTYFLRDAGKQKTVAIERALSGLKTQCGASASQERLLACNSASQFLTEAALSIEPHNSPLREWRPSPDGELRVIVDRYSAERIEIMSSVAVTEWRMKLAAMLAIALMLGSLFLYVWLQPSNKLLDAPFLPKRHL